MTNSSTEARLELQGIGVAPGVCVGRVFVIDRRQQKRPRYHIQPEAANKEIERFFEAQRRAVETMQQLIAEHESQKTKEPTQILNAHILMLQDPLLSEQIENEIRVHHRCAEWAVAETVRQIRARFEKLGHAYFRERRSDVDFIGDHILSEMTNDSTTTADELPPQAIVVGYDISPADILELLKKDTRAIVTQVGGKTSHTAVLAHAMEIPAVVGCPSILTHAATNDMIVVNGNTGAVILSPTESEQLQYAHDEQVQKERNQAYLSESHKPAISPDGYSTSIVANIDLAEESSSAFSHGAMGIGLFRTEYLFMNRSELPSLNDHVEAYSSVMSQAPTDASIIYRTFDLGSDKMSSLIQMGHEENPALGLRACRLGLSHQDIFRQQLRALLIATADARGSIMLPMISGLQELRDVKDLIYREMDNLESEGLTFRRDVPIGMMIELPSAAMISDVLAQECDFFSVGTNDLIQYFLAIDRNNEKLSYLYRPLHPALLRTMKMVVTNAHAAKIPVSLCGEMAADPVCLPVCFGLGFDSLSVPIASLPRVKWFRRQYPQAKAKSLLDEVLGMATCDEVEKRVRDELRHYERELVSQQED